MASSVFSCLACDKHFNGPTSYSAHLQGEKHKKKLKTLALLKNIAGVSEATGCAGILAEKENAVPPPVVPPIKRNVRNAYTCSICDVLVNSRVTMEAHIQGKQHQRRLYKDQCQRQLVNAVKTEPPGAALQCGRSDPMPKSEAATIPEKPQCGLEAEDLSCQRCGIVLFKSIDYKIKHREICDLVESERRRKAKSADDEEWEALQGLINLAIANND
ncbi:hypothetical protein MRX96_027866 [Rhipicephalus microplus]|uniref:C2H2-type domain-containing protein n=1 Tax=Rhipicephalus microplus TaxID=6941 RepID=A0A9J6EBR1_RHIMP|nr:hypothetical protein HPB51_020733 [Rhipicephalus microplus]